MAKITAPFQIEGTIDDLNFFIDEYGINRARLKPESNMTTEKFKTLPSFHKARMQNIEFGQCATKAKTFRLLAAEFNKQAKDGRFAGRANKLLLEVLQEDQKNELGSRLFTEGIKTKFGQEFLIGFESNKHRPISKVFIDNNKWEIRNNRFSHPDFNPANDINWPEEATHVTFNLAIANWNIENDTFSTNYGQPIIISKNEEKQNIVLEVVPPIEQNLQITFIFIGFSKQRGSRDIALHRKYNTATIIAYQYL
ncbi:hypothetical protein [Flavobacterium sp. N3904]|uniref:hypothetical protein n=1 Tax=Flavobacterium sp. N3904 TaxID=2986835 RepID=UPI002223F49D|nr:hypothetical protein [Flavobacterium sp. N3904]